MRPLLASLNARQARTRQGRWSWRDGMGGLGSDGASDSDEELDYSGARAHVAGAGEASAGLTAETSETETDDEETPRGAPVCRQLRSSHRSRESQLVPMRALGPCTLSALRDPL
jgi:hypothetical protein